MCNEDSAESVVAVGEIEFVVVDGDDGPDGIHFWLEEGEVNGYYFVVVVFVGAFTVLYGTGF